MCTAEKKGTLSAFTAFKVAMLVADNKVSNCSQTPQKKTNKSIIIYTMSTKQNSPGQAGEHNYKSAEAAFFFHFIQPTSVTRNLIENIKYDVIESLGDSKLSELNKKPAMDLHCKTMSKLEYDVTTTMTQTSERQRPSSLCDPDKDIYQNVDMPQSETLSTYSKRS